jgi:outer membrane protein assembly factor BamB
MKKIGRLTSLLSIPAVLIILAAGILYLCHSCGKPSGASQILQKAGFQGGLIVHLGCGDGRLTAALHSDDAYLVQGLTRNREDLIKIREYFRERGLCGLVTAACWEGEHLPYIDNLVNLLVVEKPEEIPEEEIMRVLTPGGVACMKTGGGWKTKVKPWPEEIDEWTHYLYDPSNNAVSRDEVVGPPRHLQWTGGPRWSRHHDHMASLSAMVSAKGRIFYIMDEGTKSSIQLLPDWIMTARDAFNGTILWQKSIEEWWYPHLWPLKSGPAQLTRRMVAVGDSVYVTPGINEPVSALDAATGKVVRTYDGTRTAEEIIVSDGVLYLLVNHELKPVGYAQEDYHCWNERDRASASWGWDELNRQLMAVNAENGKTIWLKETPVAPMTLAVKENNVFFHDGEKIICLDRSNGRERWESVPVSRVTPIPTGYSPSLVVYKDIVLFSGKRKALTALSAENGDILWGSEQPPSGHFCPEDVLVVNNLVWAGDIANGVNRSSGIFSGRDIFTGELKKEFSPDIETFFMHQRCYPSKATERFLIPSWTGIEYIDPVTEHWTLNHWARSGCIYGILPCNGMTYITPHSCACYYQSKLRGFCALAPEKQQAVDFGNKLERFVKGPAYGKVESSESENGNAGDWPAYRHDPARSGKAGTSIPVNLAISWRCELEGKLTPPVIAGGKLFVASVDNHRLYALDSESGEILWDYTAGGRIDSPPSIYKGMVLFGSADGWVYSLLAENGDLVWRYRATPDARQLVSFNQVESVWPVHGSVLIYDDLLYCIAGRSMFLDGGMRLLRLDPVTGEKISETVMDSNDPETGNNLQDLIEVKKMPVALPDILSCDGKFVYMRSQRFDMEGKRTKIAPENQHDQLGEGIHLFSPTGFTDDSWFHRSYWIYGKNAGEGWSEWFIPGRYVPYGRILVFDDNLVYGYQRDPQYLCNSSVLEYRLFAASKEARPERIEFVRSIKIPNDNIHWKNRSLHPDSELTAIDYRWISEHPPLLVNAMVLSDHTLFIAGPPDLVDEREIWGKYHMSYYHGKLQKQLDALEGEKGSLLQAVSASTGEKLAEYTLESLPVFDGMAAAEGRLFMTMKDGSVFCFGPG